MFPHLTSWSKRDGGSGSKVVDSGAHNDLDGVEVSNSTPPLFYQGSRISKDKEVLRQYSSIKSVLKTSLPPDAQPALVPSAIIDLDENHVANGTFSPLLPASPTPESDLEMTIPLALNEKTGSIASSAPMQRFPSSASQPQDPFTQVKRTPYPNSGVQNKSILGTKFQSSPLKANFYSLTNGPMDDNTEFVSASVTSGPDTSTAEIQGENGSSSTVEGQHVGNVAASVAEEPNSQNVTAGILEENNELIAEVQHELRKAEAAADKLDDSSFIMPGSLNQNLSLNHPSVASKAEAKSRSVLEKPPAPNHIYTDPLPSSDHAVPIVHEMKRKFAESSLESPNVARRHRRFKVQSDFTLAERSEAPRDPLEGARQFRREFLASRRSSESSTPTMSPTIPVAVFPWTKSENPRDPSERARQMRQESLTSRRSSETSTPITNPGLQAEQRSVEVQINVDEETMHVQSVDTMTEREKVIELSSRSQTQEMESDLAPLPNGTASIGPDGDDAKPGARDNASFGYEADSLKLVLQNAGAKVPNAESSVVIEPSSHPSNDEIQRAQPVELDDFLYSPHHRLDLANGKDNLDETFDPGDDLMIANHDQLVNTNEDDRAVDPEPDNAGEDLPTRAFEVAEQGSNALTPEMMLSQVAEPDTAALESPRPQLSIEENGDARMPDRVASELPSERQSLRVEADTDEVGKKPTLQQGLNGADPSMPDVQVDQAITPWNSIAHMSGPMDQSGSLSFGFSALVAESNVENQTRLPPAAVEPAISLSNPRSDPEVGSVEEHQHALKLAIEIVAQKPPSVPQNIFDRFRAAYPTYPGDTKHFADMCREINRLAEANRMIHQSLWDDFIVRHKIEYPQYVRRCAEEAGEAAPYETFFNTEIEGLQYQKRVINRRNLDEALALIATVEQNVEPQDEDEACVEPVEHNFTSKTDPAMKTMHEHAPANDAGPLELVGTQHTPKSASFHGIMQKLSKSRVAMNLNAESVHSETIRDGEHQVEPCKPKSAFKTESRVVIDLTEDDLPDELPKKIKERQNPLQPNFSHLINGASIKPPPLRYRQDSSGSLYRIPYTPPAVPDSHVPLPPQSMRSPIVPATASTKCATKSNGRSLPWVESDHGILQSSATASASDSPKGFPNSELQEVRAKNSSNVRSQLPAKSTLSSAKQSQRLLNTCHRVIQSNWGIKAHELLEPEYYHGQALSETMIELLASIASKVKVGEARDRMKAAIDTRITDNARRGAGHPSQERKMLKSDIEVVRDIVETSSTSTTSPFSLPHTNGAVEKQNEGTPSNWWDDDNSPFKSFARAYTSIRPGSNNSFAEANSGKPGNAKKEEEAAATGVQLKMDITRWKL